MDKHARHAPTARFTQHGWQRWTPRKVRLSWFARLIAWLTA